MTTQVWEKPEWRAHLDQEGYAVHDRDKVLYTVTGPKGRLVGCAFTLWGAKMAISRDKRKQARKQDKPEKMRYWEYPVVYQDPEPFCVLCKEEENAR